MTATVQVCTRCGQRFAGECGHCHLEQLHEEHAQRVELARRRLEGIIPPPDPAGRLPRPSLSSV